MDAQIRAVYREILSSAATYRALEDEFKDHLGDNLFKENDDDEDDEENPRIKVTRSSVEDCNDLKGTVTRKMTLCYFKIIDLTNYQYAYDDAKCKIFCTRLADYTLKQASSRRRSRLWIDFVTRDKTWTKKRPRSESWHYTGSEFIARCVIHYLLFGSWPDYDPGPGNKDNDDDEDDDDNDDDNDDDDDDDNVDADVDDESENGDIGNDAKDDGLASPFANSSDDDGGDDDDDDDSKDNINYEMDCDEGGEGNCVDNNDGDDDVSVQVVDVKQSELIDNDEEDDRDDNSDDQSIASLMISSAKRRKRKVIVSDCEYESDDMKSNYTKVDRSSAAVVTGTDSDTDNQDITPGDKGLQQVSKSKGCVRAIKKKKSKSNNGGTDGQENIPAGNKRLHKNAIARKRLIAAIKKNSHSKNKKKKKHYESKSKGKGLNGNTNTSKSSVRSNEASDTSKSKMKTKGTCGKKTSSKTSWGCAESTAVRYLYLHRLYWKIVVQNSPKDVELMTQEFYKALGRFNKIIQKNMDDHKMKKKKSYTRYSKLNIGGSEVRNYITKKWITDRRCDVNKFYRRKGLTRDFKTIKPWPRDHKFTINDLLPTTNDTRDKEAFYLEQIVKWLGEPSNGARCRVSVKRKRKDVKSSKPASNKTRKLSVESAGPTSEPITVEDTQEGNLRQLQTLSQSFETIGNRMLRQMESISSTIKMLLD